MTHNVLMLVFAIQNIYWELDHILCVNLLRNTKKDGAIQKSIALFQIHTKPRLCSKRSRITSTMKSRKLGSSISQPRHYWQQIWQLKHCCYWRYLQLEEATHSRITLSDYFWHHKPVVELHSQNQERSCTLKHLLLQS